MKAYVTKMGGTNATALNGNGIYINILSLGSNGALPVYNSSYDAVIFSNYSYNIPNVANVVSLLD